MQPYVSSLKMLTKFSDRINIVVVGANDGKTNDPVYEFSMKMHDRTSVCLIEPNNLLLPVLEENYASHPSHTILNCAVGPEGTLTLYAIKQEYWESFQPAYASDWPSYRAATGVTSANRSFVESALGKHSDLDPDEVITTLDVPTKKLDMALAEAGWPMPIDLLQIDVEGYDDAVVYSSNLRLLAPKLIFFESELLSTNKYDALVSYLADHGYRTYRLGMNSLAVCKLLRRHCLHLNAIVILSLCKRKIGKMVGRIGVR